MGYDESFRGRISVLESEADRKAATFRLQPGLSDPEDPDLVSLEAVDRPGWFLWAGQPREGGIATLLGGPTSAVFLRSSEDSNQDFAAAATFRRQPGLADPAGTTFESVAYPERILRHANFLLWVSPNDGREVTLFDATFLQRPPRYEPPPGGVAVEPAGLEGITQAHNDWRAVVGVAPLTWSTDLHDQAQAYANQLANDGKCGLVHGSSGENLASRGPLSLFDGQGNITRLVPQTAPRDVVNSWGSEKRNYDLPTGTCNQQPCGHYTQMVWANSTEIGCGVAVCTNPTNENRTNRQIWVCRYNPPGNFIRQEPYKQSEEPFEVTLEAERDTFLREGRANANEGAGTTLQVAGGQRALVGFSAATATVADSLTGATLSLSLERVNGAPGGGSAHCLQPLPQNQLDTVSIAIGDGLWREGNGDSSLPNAAGSGAGATWNCSRDEEIGDARQTCYPANISAPWNGASTGPLAVLRQTASQQLDDGQSGLITFNVRRHVGAGASDWRLALCDESEATISRWHSKESVSQPGATPEQAPRLILQLSRNY